MRTFPALTAILALSAAVFGQKDPYKEDTRALAAAGKVENGIYSNRHAGFLVHLPLTPCEPQLNPDVGQHSARLLDCIHEVEGDGWYLFSINTDRWADYQLVDVEQYVSGLRHLGEVGPEDGSKRDPYIMKTVEPETSRKWAGLHFVELIMSIHKAGETETHYKGATCTHLKGYVLCFDAEARSPEFVRKLLSLEGKLEMTGSPPAPQPALRRKK